MPNIARLGHVGIHCRDLQAQTDFYTGVLGLQLTDSDPEFGMSFLSARPDDEHHELLLCAGRNGPEDIMLLQQISFRCDTLEDIIGYYETFKKHNVRFDMIVTHGNAIGIYFYDPEGNRCEVYWNTGLKARQPFVERLDLDLPPEQVMEKVRAFVDRYAGTGYIDPSLLEAQNIKQGSLAGE